MTSDPSPPGDEPDALAALDPVTREAVAWLVRLRSGTHTAQDEHDYDAWKSSDPSHLAAAERAAQLWDMLGRAFDSAPPDRTKKITPRLPVVAFALAGSTALLIGSGVLGPPSSWFADESTGIGERRTVVLADGSQIDLDTRTSFDVDEGGRRITLHTGQIFVTVARDPTRPFLVQSGQGHVRALGTAFDVRRDGETTRVAVTESAVRVTTPTSADQMSVVDVSAGQQTSYTPQTGALPPRPAELQTVTAWRQGELRFDGRPLGEVMTELSRYRRGAVVFTDDSLRRLPVTGVFRVENIDSVLNAIAVLAPVKVWRLPYLTIIQREVRQQSTR